MPCSLRIGCLNSGVVRPEGQEEPAEGRALRLKCFKESGTGSSRFGRPQPQALSAVRLYILPSLLLACAAFAEADGCEERMTWRSIPKFYALDSRQQRANAKGCEVQVYYSLSAKGHATVYRIEHNSERCFFLVNEASRSLTFSTFTAGTSEEECRMNYVVETLNGT